VIRYSYELIMRTRFDILLPPEPLAFSLFLTSAYQSIRGALDSLLFVPFRDDFEEGRRIFRACSNNLYWLFLSPLSRQSKGLNDQIEIGTLQAMRVYMSR
jgi:hypothetical protein